MSTNKIKYPILFIKSYGNILFFLKNMYYNIVKKVEIYFILCYNLQKCENIVMEVIFMKKQNGAGAIVDSIVKFAGDAAIKIKKMDKRMLLMIAAAVVLVIIILALIIHGVSAGKGKENQSVPSANNGIVAENDKTTDDEAANYSPKPNQTGTFKVNTGSELPLNMRIAADRNSQVLVTIPNDTVLEVLFVDDSEAKNPGDYGWGYVEYKGERGWVFMEYLKAE